MDRIGRKGLDSRKLRMESLESRALLAGHSAGASFGLATAAMHHSLPETVAAHVGGTAGGANVMAGASAAAATQTVLVAHLAQTDGMGTGAGEAALHTSTAGGVTTSKLAVEVYGATPNATFDVAIDGTSVGTLTTNSNGRGELVLFSNPKGAQQPLPTGLSVAEGSSITLTSSSDSADELSGAFAKISKPAVPQPVNLKATLATEGSTAKGFASYHSVTVRGTTKTHLEIVVIGAEPNAELAVMIGGTQVGTLTTNARGRGALRISDPNLTIAANDVISVGALTGTFTKVGKK